MKTITLALLFVFSLTSSTFAQWYEPTPCYACDVDTSYSRPNNQGYTSNYGLGPDNGTSFGGGAPQGEWRSNDYGSYQPYQQPQSQNDWGYQEEFRFRDQQTPSRGSYGVPGTGKPIAPCGPYYAPRAAENCY